MCPHFALSSAAYGSEDARKRRADVESERRDRRRYVVTMKLTDRPHVMRDDGTVGQHD